MKKYIQDLHAKNYNILMQEIKALNKWACCVHGLEDSRVKMKILPALMRRFNASSTKSQDLCTSRKFYSKFIWKGKQ